ncbi:hypothetical protein AC141_08820 [Bacteroides fragilis]|nr:hypothetical protein AC141_08820 [Bacteroides fragilis]
MTEGRREGHNILVSNEISKESSSFSPNNTYTVMKEIFAISTTKFSIVNRNK